MKNKKIMVLLCVLTLCVPVCLMADDDYVSDLFRMPSINPTLTGSFTEAMNSVHNGMLEYNGPEYFFFDMKYKFLVWEDMMAGSVFMGGMLPLSKNFTIPVFFNLTMNSSGDVFDDYTRDRDGFMIGGGLIFYGRFGLLAGYAGYSWEWGSEWTRNHDDNKWSEEKFQWAVFSVINAKELPLLNSFVKLIDGFFSLDQLRMDRGEFQPTYKANVLFKDIYLSRYRYGYSPTIKMSLGAYTLTDWYDFDAKYNLHVGKIDFTINDFLGEYLQMIIGIEGGYRNFFDIQLTNQDFENGVYSKIALKFTYPLGYSTMGIMFFWESGSKSFFNNYHFGAMLSISASEGYIPAFSALFRTDPTVSIKCGWFGDRDKR